MSKMPEIFGSLVFNDTVMKARLPHDTYKSFKKKLAKGEPLDRPTADVIANAMKDWALEKGVTHYTHWFQPMTEITAEKHEAFITPSGDTVIMEFSGKELIQGEPDASSFPSGGLRATFEARGYTAWDPTSYAFIKENTLVIPTAFISYTGEVLDKKTPLLRSMDALNIQALRILKLFGRTEVKRVVTTVGPEQEYFLIDKSMYDKRPDLIYTGRTLFGARPPKGQELEDHYFGALKKRVGDFMHDLDETLWKLGVLAKTEHNEVAPAQHELAPIYNNTNIGTDHNQLTMEMMKKTASEHGLVCLLHEKPFAGVNGSGKHNNWSIGTDDGAEPAGTRQRRRSENTQFLLFLSGDHPCGGRVCRSFCAFPAAGSGQGPSAGRERGSSGHHLHVPGRGADRHRRGADRQGRLQPARPRTMMLDIGVAVLPDFFKDTTDRNRTSPFAFTGNKFEFRMVGSAFSIADPNTVLNTVVAESLRMFADELEKAEDFNTALNKPDPPHHPRPQAHHLQRQQLCRRVGDRGRRARACSTGSPPPKPSRTSPTTKNIGAV